MQISGLSARFHKLVFVGNEWTSPRRDRTYFALSRKGDSVLFDTSPRHTVEGKLLVPETETNAPAERARFASVLCSAQLIQSSRWVTRCRNGHCAQCRLYDACACMCSTNACHEAASSNGTSDVPDWLPCRPNMLICLLTAIPCARSDSAQSEILSVTGSFTSK